MKRYKIFFIVFSLLFISCENFYYPDNDIEKIRQKETHKIFKDLGQEPIVLTMPIYQYSYLFGNKKWNSKCKSIGDIFVIFDCTTNSVFDWCYFSQNKYITEGRTVKQDYKGKTSYYNFGYLSNKVAYITPENENINIVDCDTFESNWTYETKGKYCLLTKTVPCPEDEKASTKELFYAYDTDEKKIAPYHAEINQDKHIGYLLCDESGRFWGSYSYDKNNNFFYIDYEKGETVVFDKCPQIYSERFSPLYIDENYLVFGNVAYINSDSNIEDYSEFSRLKVFSFTENKFIKEIPIKMKESHYTAAIFSVNGSKKLMLSNGGEFGLYFCDFDFDMTEIVPNEKLDMTFWYTSNVFPRGNKVYLVHSGFSDIYKITYFDFSKNEQGPVYNLDAYKISSK